MNGREDLDYHRNDAVISAIPCLNHHTFILRFSWLFLTSSILLQFVTHFFGPTRWLLLLSLQLCKAFVSPWPWARLTLWPIDYVSLSVWRLFI